MKALGDLAFTRGINSYDFHRFTHQPWLNRVPGMTMGKWGSTLERTNTWWDEGAAWIDYLRRCDYLLQKGLYVADLLYFDGLDIPNLGAVPSLKNGYAYDGCDEDVILHRLSVKDGRLTLPDGMSYRVLVLPATDRITPVLLRKIKELADAGATIVGPRPVASPSLTDYPSGDEEVKRLADEIWGSGKIVSDKSPEAVLSGLAVPPDFEANAPVQPLYIHRVAGDTDFYFVSNQEKANVDVDCAFRVTDKVPEFWHADTGKTEKVALYSEAENRTHIPLHLDPAGSVFVVFRPRTAPMDHPVVVTRTGADPASPPDSQLPADVLSIADGGGYRLETWKPGDYEIKTAANKTLTRDVANVAAPMEVDGPWELEFPPNWGAPSQVTLDKLLSWPGSTVPGVKYFSGTATYRKTLSIPEDMVGPGRRLYLDLGDVQVIARVRLNGKDLGVLWKPPYRTEITSLAKVGDNDLQVSVTNLWPNRVIGDDQLPEDCEWNANGSLKQWPQWLVDGKSSPTGRFTFATWKHYNRNSSLFPSGLIGPVRLLPAVEVDLH
jgi:hypothetical protein